MRFLILSALLVGCGSDDGAPGSDGGRGPGGSAGSGTAAAGGSADDGDGATGGSGGSTAGSCSPAPNTGGGSPLLSCSEIAVLGFCGECIDEKCCTLAELCTVDDDCACMAECIGPSLSLTNDCLTTCGLTGSPPGFADLAQCAATACANFNVGGECTVPQGYEPPPEMTPTEPTSNASIASGSLADCGFGPADPSGAVLQLQSTDGSVCVRLDRRNDGPGTLANTNWTLLSMAVGPLGEVVLIDDPGNVCWHSSHHNFNDWAHAWSGSRHYEIKASRTGHDIVVPTFELLVFEQGPLEAGTCSPVSDGTCPIATMDLVTVP